MGELWALVYHGWDDPELDSTVWDELSLASPKNWPALAAKSASLTDRFQEFFNSAAMALTLPRAGAGNHMVTAGLLITHIQHTIFSNIAYGNSTDPNEALKDFLWDVKGKKDCAYYIYLGAKAASMELVDRQKDSFNGMEALRHRVYSSLYVGALIRNYIDVMRAQAVINEVSVPESDVQLAKRIAGGEENISDRIMYGSAAIIESFGLAEHYFLPKPETIADVVAEEVKNLPASARENIINSMRFNSGLKS